jgi:hypothetical protein
MDVMAAAPVCVEREQKRERDLAAMTGVGRFLSRDKFIIIIKKTFNNKFYFN